MSNRSLFFLLMICWVSVSPDFISPLCAQKDKNGQTGGEAGPLAQTGNKKKGAKTEEITLSNITDVPYIGIAQVLDSVSDLSRSFALYQLFLDRPIIRQGVTLPPVLIDYPFAAPYAISGIVSPTGTLIKFYEKGKKVAEHSLAGDDWQSIWVKVSAWLNGQPLTLGKKEKVEVDEGAPFDMPRYTPIEEMLPGRDMKIKIPDVDIITRTDYLNPWSMSYKQSQEDPRRLLRHVYGNYSSFDENSIYFFKGVDVPTDAQNAARALALPLYRTPRPALQYLGTLKYLEEKNDPGAAFQACLAALSSSDDIFVGPQEQSLLREKAFLKMAQLQRMISPARKRTHSLFQFAAKLNEVYNKDTLAIGESKRYYAAIDPLKEQLKKTEAMANKVRSTRLIGAINAAGSFMGGVSASLGGASQSISQSYMNLMQNTMNQTLMVTNTMRSRVRELFEGIDRSVNASSFLAGQELEADFGKPLVAAEVYYHLTRHPELMKEPLAEYASDKPKLYKMLREFYLGKFPEKALANVYEHFALLERTILNYECRGITIPEKTLKQF